MTSSRPDSPRREPRAGPWNIANVSQAGARPLGRFGRLALAAILVLGTAMASADPITLLGFLSYAAVGALLIRRRPGNGVSWLLLAIGFGSILTSTPPNLDLAALEAGRASTRDFLLTWFSSWAGYASYLCFLALTLLFPAGHLPPGRWRRRVIALLAAGAVMVGLAATAPSINFNIDASTAVIIPNRLAILPDLPLWSIVPTGTMIVPMVVLVTIGAGSIIVRYRRATGILRLQLRWLVAAIAFVVVAVVVGLSTLLVFGEDSGGLGWIPAIVAYPMVPLAIGIAIFRYRLYEIDRIISRTLGWALVTAALVGTFGGLVVALQTVLAPLTAGSTLAVAGSTLAVAALFQPVRRRVQAAVDRRFDRGRYDAARVVERFAGRVRDQLDLATLAAEVARVAIETVRPTSAAVWLRHHGEQQRRSAR